MELIVKCQSPDNMFLSRFFLKWKLALELVICISSAGTCAHTLTTFPIRLLGPHEIFSVFRVISVNFFGPPLCIWPTTHLSSHLPEKHKDGSVSQALQAGYRLGLSGGGYPSPTDVEEPQGQPETSAAEMLGLAPGWPARPARVPHTCLLLCHSK